MSRRPFLVALALTVVFGCGERARFSPVGEVVGLPTQFEWPASRAATSYLVQCFAKDGSILHESKRLKTNTLPIRNKLRDKLLSEGEFTWRVRVYDGDRIAGYSEPTRVNVMTVQESAPSSERSSS